jgi:hypothetical protein
MFTCRHFLGNRPHRLRRSGAFGRSGRENCSTPCLPCRRNERCRNRGGAWNRLRTRRTQPSRSQPGTWNRKLRKPTIQAHLNVGGRIHWRMTERTGPIAIKTNFGRNNGESVRLAFRTSHNTPRRKVAFRNSKKYKKSVENPIYPLGLYLFNKNCANLDRNIDFLQFLRSSCLLHK